MLGYLEEARALAAILGFEARDLAPDLVETWVVNDPLHSQYGDVVPQEALFNEAICIRRGDFGLVEVDGAWTHCVRLGGISTHAPALPTWSDYRRVIASRKGKDCRLLGDVRDHDGVRFLSLREGLEKMVEEKLIGYPLRGPRAAREMLVALRDAGQSSFDEHHIIWNKQSGIAEKSSTAREHRLLCKVLRLLLQFDQIDLSNSAGAEMLVRRLLQLEAATRRNPRQPDFEGLDIILDWAVDDHGAAVVSSFSSWVADQQRNEATTLKASRQWREEQSSREKGPKFKKEKKEE